MDWQKIVEECNEIHRKTITQENYIIITTEPLINPIEDVNWVEEGF